MNNPPNDSPKSYVHDTPLSKRIFQRLAKKSGQKIRFDEFMELALYHPQHGYYASSIGKKIGREGDFFTSVSVGDTFGMLLSHIIEKKWSKICPRQDSPLVIVEQGAHDGRLARDIIDGFRERDSPLLPQIDYRIVEPRVENRTELAEVINSRGDHDWLTPVESIDKARSKAGIFLCNELLDAFPVRRFVWDDQWREIWVSLDHSANRLVQTTESIDHENDGDFIRFRNLIGNEKFKNGYTTEFSPSLKSWIDSSSTLFARSGYWIMIDYGFESAEYYSPFRNTGTLKCYHNHSTHDDPLLWPGENDITAHVNFSDLISVASEAGMQLDSLTDQSAFLTHAAKDWLLGLEGRIPSKKDAARLRQFQTLTHPGMMGQSFKVAEFSKSS